MNTNSVSHIPSGQMALTGQRRQMTGMGISFLIHAIVLCALLSMRAALPDVQPPLVIDFSLEKAFEAPKVQKLFAQMDEQQEQIIAEIEPIPLPKEIVPEPVEITEQIEIEKPVPVEEPMPEIVEVLVPIEPEPEPEPVLQPIEEKQVVVIRELTPRLLKKKIVAKKKKPKQANPVKNPKIAVKEIAPKQEVSNTASNKATLAPPPAPIAAPQIIKPAVQPQEQYVKEHFLYIKDSVQGKITYPRIARKMGWQGRVLISFTICRDGSVKDIRIVESSGFKALDNNAVKVIQKVAPFPRPPVSAELTIPVIYKLS